MGKPICYYTELYFQKSELLNLKQLFITDIFRITYRSNKYNENILNAK